MIRIKNLTKDYGANRGVFDLSFEVQRPLGCLDLGEQERQPYFRF